jgi:hypothetical protein
VCVCVGVEGGDLMMIWGDLQQQKKVSRSYNFLWFGNIMVIRNKSKVCSRDHANIQIITLFYEQNLNSKVVIPNHPNPPD